MNFRHRKPPATIDDDVVALIRKGGLAPDDIDILPCPPSRCGDDAGWWVDIRVWLRDDDVVLDEVTLSATETAQRDAADAALEGVQRFAECLINGLHIAGPSEPQ